MLNLKFTLFLLLALFTSAFINSIYAQNQTVKIEGVILDKSSETPLPGATLYIEETRQGYIADESGYFSFSLRKGNYTLVSSFVGYQSRKTKISATQNLKLEIHMSDQTALEEVVVTARSKEANISNLTMGVERLSIGEIKKMPALMGEVDVIKAVQLLPGVQATSEGSSGFSVRGGSPDQNLILLDNTTVYNASHLMGFFSVFNNDVISDLELYKGDIPLKHGGRLASLLDIKTIDTFPKKFSASGGIGLIFSRLALKGKAGEKTSWMIGGRRSYADLFLKLSNDEDLKDLSLYFYDLNAKITHRLSQRDNISLNLYYGKDNFGTDEYGFNYGNMANSLTWGHLYNNDRLYSRFGIHQSQYNYRLYSNIEGAKMTWKSIIDDLMFRADFTYNDSRSLNLSFGGTATYHLLKPGLIQSEDYDDFKMDHSSALEAALYASNEQKLTDLLSVKYGLRWSFFRNQQTYQTVEPRVGLVYRLTDYSSIKANYANNTQYIQLANSSSSNSPLDIWFLSGPDIKPQKANLWSTGYFHNFEDNNYEASMEIYYKDLKNVIDFSDHADLILNKELEKEVRTGKGKAYGMEFMLRKNKGKVNGFVNYTLSRAERTIPEINQGKTYLSPYDKTNSVNVVLNFELSRKITLSGVWVYATGTPATYPSGRFEIDGEYFPIYSGRNEYRKPDYHRLDLSLTYTPNPNAKKRYRSEWSFSIYNAYGRKNPYLITFEQESDTGVPYAESVYLFNMVPSITYNFKF